MVKIKWTKKASGDLRDIHNYIAKDSLLYAIRFTNKLTSAVDHLETFSYPVELFPKKMMK